LAKISALPKVIAFVGPMGSGKSTLAKLVKEVLGGEIISFAGPLKKAALAMQIPYENVYGTPEQKAEPLAILGGMSSRRFQQLLGTEFARNLVCDDFWIRQFEAAVWAAKSEFVFCDDLRFLNEAAAIKKLGGVIIRVIRNGKTVAASEHPSETEQLLIDADYGMVNDDSLDVMRQRLANLRKDLERES
jgi:energy-coupling factor transporter ATP-binding protein EcfA2